MMLNIFMKHAKMTEETITHVNPICRNYLRSKYQTNQWILALLSQTHRFKMKKEHAVLCLCRELCINFVFS